jgi:flagellar biosynthesis protein FliR
VAAMLLTTVALGLIARTVPQMNVFIVAMPVKILVGLMFLGLSLPYLATFLSQVFNRLTADILLLLKLMAG